eukprot:TRINITY_DN4994_c0_g1_i1.p1 TRINITY_DN4994_c0_g1~~TRINITY_DN4994_c0_g1_i1.p1  ORF type:complete len:292 (-),score=68.28 TRINITY_DN4994_c0_g1_i1:196-942(-)
MSDGEVILFKYPPHHSTLFVYNVPKDVNVDALMDLFASYGLMNDFVVTEDPSKPTSFATARYYSKVASSKALSELNGFMVNGFSLKIQPSKYGKDKEPDLPITKSIELMNHFAGFNQWTTQITALEQTKIELVQTNANDLDDQNKVTKVACEHLCSIKLSLKDGRYVVGTGVGKSLHPNPMVSRELSRKLAVTSARKHCFQKVAIVVLGTGRVAIHCMADQTMEEENDEVDFPTHNKIGVLLGNNIDF